MKQHEGSSKNSHNGSPSSSTKKRKAPEPEATCNSEMTITLDSLEESILRRTAEPLVIDDTLRQPKRMHKPAFDNTSPCQGCGVVGVKIWRIGPNGRATLCDKCGDKAKQGTLADRVAPKATAASPPAVNASQMLNGGQVTRPPILNQQPLPAVVQGKTQTPSLNSPASAFDRPSASEPNQSVPSVLQPRPPAGSGLDRRQGAWSNQEHRVASTSMTPSEPRLLSQASPFSSTNIQGKLPVETHEQDQEMRYVPGPTDLETSRLAGPPQKSNPVTPQDGQLPSPWPTPAGHTNVRPPGYSYHAPQTMSGYIPPRRILPSAVSRTPMTGIGHSPLPDAQRTPLNTKTPPLIDEAMLPSPLRSAQAASLPATNTGGSSAGDFGTAETSATQSEVPASTIQATESANPKSDIRSDDLPSRALPTKDSEVYPPVLESRTISPHTADSSADPSASTGK